MKRLNNLRNRKASVTAFVALVLASVCLLNCALLDLATGISFKRYAQGRVNLACDSILASFDSLLASKYGLYGVNRVRAGNVEETFGTYITEHRMDGIVDFKDFPLVRKDVRLKEALSEPGILRTQIVEQMRFRTPVRGATWLLDQLNVIESAEEAGKGVLYVARGSELLQASESKLERLKLLVEGAFPGDTACVNGYPKALLFHVELEPTLLSLQVLSGKDISFISQIAKEHRDLRNLVMTYYDYHTESIGLIRELRMIAQEIRALIQQAQSCSDAAVSGSGLHEMIQKLKEQVGTISNTANLTGLEKNVQLLTAKIEGLDANLKILEDYTLITEEKYSLKNFLDNIQGALSVNGIEDRFVVFTVRESSGMNTDEVPPVEEAFGTVNGADFVIPSAIYTTLPSVEAKVAAEKNSLLIDFSDLEGLWNLFEGGSCTDGIASAMRAAYEELLVDDYVLCYFGNTVFPKSGSYLTGEMEYILGGHAEMEENIEVVEEKLMFLRFVLNLSHILTDSDKCALADEMGRAIAVAISAGIGGTFYAALIMCAWSAVESYEDLDLLREGKDIPLIKRDIDWNTSIEGLFKDKEDSGADNVTSLSYTEYLLILLLMEDGETKLYRIADLIEMNMTHQTGLRYRLSGVYTRVHANVVYQPDYISFGLFDVLRRKDYEICVVGEQTYGS